MTHPSIHCPNCGRQLTFEAASTSCVCGESYAVHEGIPIVLAKKFLDEFKTQEQHFHDDVSSSRVGQRIESRNAAFHWHFKRPMLKLPGAATILEVACGARADSIELALAGKTVTATDLSPAMVEHARRVATRAGIGSRIRFLVADGEHLPFADRTFDATFTAASFHHFPDQLKALLEMRRVTRPGGLVIWGVEPQAWPYRSVFRALAPVKRVIRRRRPRAHHSVADDSTSGYTEADIRRLFADAELEVVEVRPVKFFSEWYDSAVRLIGKLARREVHPWPGPGRTLAAIDSYLERLPAVNRLCWHWNVISRVPTA